MAKANLTLPNGTSVTIDGTADEVALLLNTFSNPVGTVGKVSGKKTSRGKSSATPRPPKAKKDGPTGLITELADEGYFKTKRGIADIQKKLEERGHIYAITSISPCLTRLTKKRILRRLKETKGWVYVN
jgi:hypothetical protein